MLAALRLRLARLLSMVRRGCALGILTFLGIFALYLLAFSRVFEWPGNLIAAGFGGLFGAMGLGGMSHLLWARRDAAAFARFARRTPPTHGALTVAAGPIRALSAPLASPLGGRPCVAYDYEVLPTGTTTRGSKDGQRRDLAGFAMAASAVDTPLGSVRILGFPLLDEFPLSREGGLEAWARAEQYASRTPFEAVKGVGVFQLLRAVDDAVADADGAVRKDFRLTDGPIPFGERMLRERVVPVGEMVCALGRYDSEKRGLVPAGATLNRLWPGTAAQIRGRILRTARQQAVIGFVFFAVSHAMLAAAFYLSETRHARQPEAAQAAAIRSAVQDRDLAALERAVRRGANPNARDAFGDPVLLDVRDPEIAAALVRLGADVNVRDRAGEDTLLIRASRMGLASLVSVLLASGADVHLALRDGSTALAEATRGGHDDVVALLTAAGAAAPAPATAPVERPR